MDKILDIEYLKTISGELFEQLLAWFSSPQFYAQIGAIILSIIIAKFVAKQLNLKVDWFSTEPKEDVRFLKLRQFIYQASNLLFPALNYIILGIAASIVLSAVGVNWLVLLARGVAVVFLLYKAIHLFIKHPMLKTALTYLAIPIATLSVFEYLDDTTQILDSVAFQAGNIRISAFFLIKALIAGAFFFWLGSVSNKSGQNAIRNQDTLDRPTQELLAKLFQIIIFAVIFILLMQVLGLDLTALAVLGGAIGVGIGFGLQQIASNFISGIILLIERTLIVGDYIEMGDGKAGILRELNMRSATLETYDGKEIMVPNEKFITDTFINWTRDDPRQRYEVDFTVSYDSDIEKIPDIIVAAISKHPKVLSEPEKPDVELRGFGDSGVKFGVEFWISGIDDGENKISSDVLMIIWKTLKQNKIKIPFPQREIRMVGDSGLMNIKKSGGPVSKSKEK
ncbi:MAG: mechanosensitive ion channel family protein [Nitratireductor sp.]